MGKQPGSRLSGSLSDHKVPLQIQMQGAIHKLALHPLDQQLRLLHRVVQHARVERDGKGRDRLDHLHALHAADLLQLPILGPVADRDLAHVLLDVDEPRVGHPLAMQMRDVQALPDHRARAVDVADPPLTPGGAVDGVVVAVEPALVLLHLHVGAGLEVDEGLAVELGPVSDAAAEGAAVDEVEGLGEGPLALGVVDVELAVGRHPGGLDGREVRADHDGGGELVRNLDRPDACAGADVEDALWGWVSDGSGVQRAVEGHLEDVVEEVEPVLLLLVVGEEVFPVPEGVIAAPVLVAVVVDG